MSTSKPTVGRNKVISCAECRRLKLRCDRQFPCHNCTKRGLSAICPEGSLPTRPKVLLEETERLNRKNTELSERIRLLEDGLASLQAGVSDEVHPLLAKPVFDGADNLDGSTNAAKLQREIDEINDSLGTLTVEADGRSLFLGHTAGIESLFRNELQESSPQSEGAKDHSPNVLHSLGIFSSLHDSKEAVMERLQDYLPNSTVAWSLTEIYFEHGAWLYNPISKSRFLEQIFNPVYNSDSGKGSLSAVTSHNAALLFMIFTVGSFLDISRPTNDPAAQHEQYHQLARTAMSCDAILVDPTMPAIRTLMLMAYYHLLCDKNGPQHCWAMLGLASHMAQNLGLHRDSGRWKLDEAIVQERRALFWEIYWLGINQCLSFGRPPSMVLAYCDCELPRNMERLENRAGEIKPSFHLRKLQFVSECLSQVVEVVLGIKHTPYPTILALDRKVRDSQALKIPPNGASGPLELGAATVTLTLQRFMLKAVTEMTLLYLHRRFFARAVTDYPADILSCRYGPSVLAAYRSASTYIALMRGLCTLQPELPARFSIFWNHLLAASIIVGSVATKCPKCVLAPSAISELDSCFLLFEKAAKLGNSSSRPARALIIVSRLRDRAHQLVAAIQAGVLPEEPAQRGGDSRPEYEPDELSILSGRGRLVEAKHSPSPSQDLSGASPGAIGSSLGQPTPQKSFDVYDAAHPSLLNNLRMATQQQQNSTAYTSAIPWNDTWMWEGANFTEGSSPALSRYSDTEGSASPQPPGLSATASSALAGTQLIDLNQRGYGTPPQSSSVYSAQSGLEEGCPDLGATMSWESNWQGFMHQLGVSYENDTGF